jgi:hypothetical protein
LVYLVTYLRVAAGGFVLELPGLVYLVPPALDYPVFAVYEPSVLVLGFPACGSLAVVVWVPSCLVSALFDLLARYLPLPVLPFFCTLCACDLLSFASFVSSRLHDLSPFSLRTLLALLLLRSLLFFLLVRFSPLDLLNSAVIRSRWYWC